MSDITMEILEEYGEEWAKSAFEKSKKRGVEKFSDFIEKTYKEELEAMGADSDTVQIALNFIVEGKFAETGKNGIESKMDLIFGLIENSNSFNNLKDEPIFKQLSTLKGVYDTYGDDAINIANSISKLNEHIHENGAYDKEGMELLGKTVDSFLNIVGNVIEMVPGGKLFGTFLDVLQDAFNTIFPIIKDAAIERYAGNYIEADVDPDALEHILYRIIYDDKPKENWKKGPTLSELQVLYELDDEHAFIFSKYTEWRIEYEFEQALDAERKAVADATYL